MSGFMGMNMAGQAGGMNANELYAMGQQQQAQASKTESSTPVVNRWTCTCGALNSGNFCSECGVSKPKEVKGWTCTCNTVNKGKFCSECGSQKPDGIPQYACDKCNWEPADPTNPPKFCPECGDVFDENDRK